MSAADRRWIRNRVIVAIGAGAVIAGSIYSLWEPIAGLSCWAISGCNIW